MIRFLYILILFYSFSSNATENSILTSSGKISAQNQNGVLFYEDIPYAQPPVGSLRWKAPREIKITETEIQPKKDNFCVQRPSNLGGVNSDEVFVGTEDCLYLDIHKPKKQTRNCRLCFGYMGEVILQVIKISTIFQNGKKT